MRRRQKKVIVKCGIGIILIVSLIVFIEITLNNGIISYNRQFIGTTQYKEAEKADVTKVTHINHEVNLVMQQTSVLSKVNYFSQTQLLTETKHYIQNEGNLKNSNVNDGKLTDSRQKTEILVTDSTQKLMISTDKQNGGNLSTDSTPQKGNKSTNSIPNEGNLKDTSQNASTKVFVSKQYSEHKNDTDILKNCIPNIDASDIKTPFKFFIYDLPSKFNHDIHRQFTDGRDSFCYNLDYCGMGQELFQTQSYGEADIIQSVRNTHQFALEVIIHYKLMHSPYRTKDPKKADMFYIPAYTGLRCLQFKPDNKQFIKDLFIHLETHEKDYFTSGKPHFSTLSKIQREQASDNCPTLRHPATKNITFFTIEKEANPGWAKNSQIQGTSVIVAPYPAYGHFIINDHKNSLLYETRNGLKNLTHSKFRLPVPSLSKRNLTLFLAAGTRRSNGFRNILLDQFKNKTSLAPDKFYAAAANNGFLRQLMLITKECATDHRTATIPWMQQSVFCLQPPGDSPTRKSIYDSILSGCIPVFFTNRHMPEYPFQKYLNYTTFTYTIDEKLISRYDKNVYEILVQLPAEKVKALHNNLLRVAKWFQYSLPNGDLQQDDDAMTLLLHQLTHLYQLPSLPYKAV